MAENYCLKNLQNKGINNVEKNECSEAWKITKIV